MKTKLFMIVTALMLLASPIFAQEAGGGNASDANRRAAAYIAMGIASGLCGLGQGRATASAAEAMLIEMTIPSNIRWSPYLECAGRAQRRRRFGAFDKLEASLQQLNVGWIAKRRP